MGKYKILKATTSTTICYITRVPISIGTVFVLYNQLNFVDSDLHLFSNFTWTKQKMKLDILKEPVMYLLSKIKFNFLKICTYQVATTKLYQKCALETMKVIYIKLLLLKKAICGNYYFSMLIFRQYVVLQAFPVYLYYKNYQAHKLMLSRGVPPTYQHKRFSNLSCYLCRYLT